MFLRNYDRVIGQVSMNSEFISESISFKIDSISSRILNILYVDAFVFFVDLLQRIPQKCYKFIFSKLKLLNVHPTA